MSSCFVAVPTSIFCSLYLCCNIIVLDQHINYMTFINCIYLYISQMFPPFYRSEDQDVLCVHCNIEVDEQYYHYI